MPTLKQLLQELRKLDVDPDEVRIPGQLYDDLVDDAEEIAEENFDNTDDNGDQCPFLHDKLYPWVMREETEQDYTNGN